MVCWLCSDKTCVHILQKNLKVHRFDLSLELLASDFILPEMHKNFWPVAVHIYAIYVFPTVCEFIVHFSCSLVPLSVFPKYLECMQIL